MNITVRLGAGLTLGNGLSRISVTLAPGACIGDLLAYLLAQYPDAHLNAAVFVIAGTHISNTELLSDGQEVAVLLPISGGSS